MRLQYVVDDRNIAEKFILELPTDLKRMRFNDESLTGAGLARWRPTHTVVAIYDGVLAAMADCVISADGKRGNYSLICKEGYGGYALRAMHQLKKRFPVDHVDTSFRQPTDALLKMARWWADYVYDQETCYAAGGLSRHIGFHPSIEPAPIAITDSNLETFGLPPIKEWCAVSRMQLAAACREPAITLSTDRCAALPRGILLGLAFEILAVPYERRQRLTRSQLAEGAVKLGAVPPQDKTASAWIDPVLAAEFQQSLAALGPEHAPAKGPVFEMRKA
jgi:hypothetical protein